MDCEQHKIISNLPTQYSSQKLNICEYFLALMKERYLVFKEQFIDQGEVYYSNLIHGVLTCFSYILEEMIPKISGFRQEELA